MGLRSGENRDRNELGLETQVEQEELDRRVPQVEQEELLDHRLGIRGVEGVDGVEVLGEEGVVTERGLVDGERES